VLDIPVEWGIELSQVVLEPPLHADLELTPVSGGVLVRGSVDVTIGHVCHRCLDEWEQELTIEVAQLFQPESRADEEDDYVFAGDELDLEPMLRDEVLLAMPLAPTCSDDCRGLVEASESDLNSGSADEGEEPTSPFAVLQDLLGPGE
jgi:uncharacterized protein